MAFLRSISILALIAAGCAQPSGARQCVNGSFCPVGTECSGDGTTCIASGGCGNAILGDREECDDGNVNDGDGCSASCKVEECGNTRIDEGEVCDDGNTVSGDGCSADCKSEEKCGNGIIDEKGGLRAEVDENGVPGDLECQDATTANDGRCKEVCEKGTPMCAADCLSIIRCGNGVKNLGELCDDGNNVGGDGCGPQCNAESEFCGNGVIDVDANGEPVEECDDGDPIDSNDCTRACKSPRCGDGIRTVNAMYHPDEPCDPSVGATGPNSPAQCTSVCTVSTCGDGIVNEAAGEQCDDGAANSNTGDCLAGPVGVGCLINVCGDGKPRTNGTNPALAEDCDDGNLDNFDGCNVDCRVPSCGNGIVDDGEECDLGALNAVTGACIPASEGPAKACKLARCGDGYTRAGVEQCDDGGTLPGGGCSALCRTETCGNGFLDPNEACDDGNMGSNDGCSFPLCQVETCGNGIKDNLEQCDPSATGPGNGPAACNIDCTPSMCGDGKPNRFASPPEECDNGAGNGAHKNCLSTCRVNRCGDGDEDQEVPGVEVCDDGDTNNANGCNVLCQHSFCGNGILDDGEDCDDGNTDDTDGCVACEHAFCGDNHTRAGFEQCDDGNANTNDSCDPNCRTPGCGNGVKSSSEQCDDGNAIDGDGCSAQCHIESCGNGRRDQGEACDPTGTLVGDNPTDCNIDCTVSTCGDGKVNALDGEDCDDGATLNNQDDCLDTCKLNRCGDSHRDMEGPAQEECDDGNTNNLDSCTNVCTSPHLHNGIVDSGEECDDGNLVNTDGCLNTGLLPTCGDGFVWMGHEDCDDGSTLGNNDDCLDTCRFNTCGDGFIDMEGPATEVCDDHNNITELNCPYNAISCTTCAMGCQSTLSLVGTFCGDGITNGGEVCDDGNHVTESACPYGTASCNVCAANCGSTVARTGNVCGDGVLDAQREDCDDRNANACGTCSANCQVSTSAPAEGVIFPASGGDLADGDSFAIDDGINPPTRFEFTNVAPGPGNIAIAYAPTDNHLLMRTKIITAINGQAGTLLVTASPTVGSLLALVHDRNTTRGNATIDNDVATPNFSVLGMSGGLGGNCTAGTGCQAGADCSSNVCTAGNTCQ